MAVAFRDLREFLAALEAQNDLRVVCGASPDLEIGAIVELNHEKKGPALLFDEIQGYGPGFRILANAMDTLPRALMTLGLPRDAALDDALNEFDRRLASFQPVPPELLATGPVFENVFQGDDVDVLKFPTPLWHEADGGRYIGTGCVVFMRDPDTGLVNFGTYRVMVHDRNTVGLYITPNHTGAIIRRKYWERGQSCPVAISIGQEPMMFLGSAQYFGQKRGVAKYDLVGHMRGSPVDVVEEPVTGLPIPATAEIVLAGEVPPPEVEARDEGPFGEWTGYYASGTRPEPVVRVKALYHRNDPIIFGTPPLRNIMVNSHFGLPTEGRRVRERLQRAGVEDVLDVVPLSIPGVVVVQIRQRYPGHAMKAALAASGEYMGRFVIVVDEDVNVHDPQEVFWAIGTRCDPATTISILTGCQSSALDPRLPPEQKKRGEYTSSRAIINACKPYEWIKDFPKANKVSAELRRQTTEKWSDLFAG
ncbi:MAG TPA: UbiD family decarboxylase [Chloroflexota bacterium]|nr:UbiD family decarboxylase [Chloroflexota bacterium]